MRTVLAAVLLLLAAAPAAHGATVTIPDAAGDIVAGPEISDIVEAHVTYSANRLRIRVTHDQWWSVWAQKKAATGGLATFGNGRSFVIVPNVTGRRSQLYTRKGFQNCPDGRSCALPCKGWAYQVDDVARTTSVSVPVRCFGTRSARVKVRPVHVIPVSGQQPVVDPIATTPWIARG